MTKKNIILITPEDQTKFKVGGLGKITKLLEVGLQEAGVEVKVVSPTENIYGPLHSKRVEWENRRLGLRAVDIINNDFRADWVWVHDWGGLWSAAEVKKYLPATKVVWTVHSPVVPTDGYVGYGYNGYSYTNESNRDKPIDWGDSFFDFSGLIKTGISLSDKITTVSKTFARNLTRSWLFEKANVIHGINNGIDKDEWGLGDCKNLVVCKRYYKSRIQQLMKLPVSDVPVFVFISRLVPQKGLNLLIQVLPRFLANNSVQFIILGSGDRYWTNKIKDLEIRFGDKLRAKLEADFELPKQLMAGADYLVLPSVSEPFGLVVAEAKRMGAIPIVHSVDGLADQVKDGITGLSFTEYNLDAFENKLMAAVRQYDSGWQKQVMVSNVNTVESYQTMTREYLGLLYE